MVHTLACNPFGEQTYLVDHGNGQASVVDPGMSNPNERRAFQALCDSLRVVPTSCVLTHAHLDHVMGCQWIHDEFGLSPVMHELDAETYERGPVAATLYEVPMDPLPEPQWGLTHGQTLQWGQCVVEVRHAPGHAPGHVVFVNHEAKWVLGGDVLFQGSVGRTDLPGCNPSDLAKSIETQLYSLPDDVVVWPGHGGPTTIGAERTSNPFVNGRGSGLLQGEAEG
ncbi:MAG TPA: MBL fold hydrolase [Flavobacteriales bacterium]|nr:MBL fold hydrolase [Flavobacteriales bacterium]